MRRKKVHFTAILTTILALPLFTVTAAPRPGVMCEYLEEIINQAVSREQALEHLEMLGKLLSREETLLLQRRIRYRFGTLSAVAKEILTTSQPPIFRPGGNSFRETALRLGVEEEFSECTTVLNRVTYYLGDEKLIPKEHAEALLSRLYDLSPRYFAFLEQEGPTRQEFTVALKKFQSALIATLFRGITDAQDSERILDLLQAVDYVLMSAFHSDQNLLAWQGYPHDEAARLEDLRERLTNYIRTQLKSMSRQAAEHQSRQLEQTYFSVLSALTHEVFLEQMLVGDPQLLIRFLQRWQKLFRPVLKATDEDILVAVHHAFGIEVLTYFANVRIGMLERQAQLTEADKILLRDLEKILMVLKRH